MAPQEVEVRYGGTPGALLNRSHTRALGIPGKLVVASCDPMGIFRDVRYPWKDWDAGRRKGSWRQTRSGGGYPGGEMLFSARSWIEPWDFPG